MQHVVYAMVTMDYAMYFPPRHLFFSEKNRDKIQVKDELLESEEAWTSQSSPALFIIYFSQHE